MILKIDLALSSKQKRLWLLFAGETKNIKITNVNNATIGYVSVLYIKKNAFFRDFNACAFITKSQNMATFKNANAMRCSN